MTTSHMQFNLSDDERLAVGLAAATLTAAQRDDMAPAAMDDKSYPIPTVAYLRRAVQSFGRAPESTRAALVAHIATRAKALGASDLGWVKNFLAAHTA